ncbi:type IV conjugative transfer system protein TraL [Diaphorobacter sp. J5-51]|uniref:type IV conjugative transfer system protein TraL n=1 Tax=Diaphorobacter sp. J5-51 TaxID=680496 RepID=UPI0006434E3C|nr:type IV conjugative transfer system protein TraL [Diaphorobacter sp. J5-51]KLR58983.1 conjugal transfer protein TraL [Diaphorobacter sp. J5-51]
MTEKPIPNYVDDQMQIFFWELDEFFPSLTMFIVMFMWDQLLVGIVMTVVFVKFFSRFKNANMSGVLFHMAWWIGLMGMNKKFDSGAMREAVK